MIQQKEINNIYNEKIFVETFTPSTIKSTVVLCHGITGCRKGRTKEDSYFQDLAQRLMDLNYKVVLFDFSGHGDSEGKDFDVTLSKSTSELAMVFQQENVEASNVQFLAFSYGAAVLCNFLMQNPTIQPKGIVMYSPCLFPLESCFLNSNSIFGKDVVKAYESGEMKETGYAVVGAKGFRLGVTMLEECKSFVPDYYKQFADRILVLSGLKDVILNTKLNDQFCEKMGIKNIYLDASHSLFEEIETAFKLTIDFFQK